MRKVLILEFNNFHTEVFPIYEEYLASLIGHKDLSIFYYSHPAKYKELKASVKNISRIYSPLKYWIASKTGLRSVYFKEILRRLMDEHNPDLIVFNSVGPDRVFDALKSIPDVKKVGIVHEFGEVDISYRDNCKYYVLGKNVYNTYKEKGIDGYLLPFYKPFDVEKKQEKNDGWVIGIQGIIDFRRRDYAFLVRLAETFLKSGILIRFNVIGSLHQRDAKKLTNMIKAKGLDKLFILHDDLSDHEFFNELSGCDFLITLLSSEYSKYFNAKITASFSHSCAYKIPLIMSVDNAKAWGINGSCAVVYDSECDIVEYFKALNDQKYDEMRVNLTKTINDKIYENKKLISADSGWFDMI